MMNRSNFTLFITFVDGFNAIDIEKKYKDESYITVSVQAREIVEFYGANNVVSVVIRNDNTLPTEEEIRNHNEIMAD